MVYDISKGCQVTENHSYLIISPVLDLNQYPIRLVFECPIKTGDMNRVGWDF